MSSSWDKAATGRPVDGLARRVTAPGPAITTTKRIQTMDSPTPLPTRRPTAAERSQPDWRDLTGLGRGRLTVVGQHQTIPGLWVVRCACGIWTCRRSRALKNPNNDDRCETCRQTRYLRHQIRRAVIKGDNGGGTPAPGGPTPTADAAEAPADSPGPSTH